MTSEQLSILYREHGALALRLFDGPPLTGADRRRLRRVRRRLSAFEYRRMKPDLDRLGRLADEQEALARSLQEVLNAAGAPAF
jgi:hypothetical protein